MSTDYNFLREQRAEADSNRGPSAYQPNALPLGQTGSQAGAPKKPVYNYRGMFMSLFERISWIEGRWSFCRLVSIDYRSMQFKSRSGTIYRTKIASISVKADELL